MQQPRSYEGLMSTFHACSQIAMLLKAQLLLDLMTNTVPSRVTVQFPVAVAVVMAVGRCRRCCRRRYAVAASWEEFRQAQ